MFSSVEGLSFLWSISDSAIIEISKLSFEKRSFVSSTRLSIEENSSFNSDFILLKGLQTGKININAELNTDGYKKIKSENKVIYVIEQFILNSEKHLYILPGNNFDYDIKQINNDNQKLGKLKLNLT
jgi:hypothetical protein